jgi:GT2 family glycosyltransferase
MPILSILIVSYNTCDLTLACLDSVQEAAQKIDYEVILVDNASSDGSVEKIKGKYPWVRLIANPENTGYSKANNLGMQMAKGDIWVLLNPDTIVDRDVFQHILNGFSQHPEAGALAPQLTNHDGTLQPSWGKFASAWTEFFFQSFLFKLLPAPFPVGRRVHPLQAPAYRRAHPVDWASGACLAVRRRVIEKTGGFDENIFMYGEDMELCWRIKESGHEIWFWPDARVAHLGNVSSKSDYSSWIQRYTKGNLDFIQGHSAANGEKMAACFILLGSLLRRIIWFFLGWVLPSVKIQALQRQTGYGLSTRIALDVLFPTGKKSIR